MEFSHDCKRIEGGQIKHYDFYDKLIKTDNFEDQSYVLASKQKAKCIDFAMAESSEKNIPVLFVFKWNLPMYHYVMDKTSAYPYEDEIMVSDGTPIQILEI